MKSFLVLQLVLLYSVITLVSSDYLPFLDLHSRVFPDDDTYSSAINIPGGLPFGNSRQTTVYVGTNGLLSFGRGISSYTPVLFTSNTTTSFNYVMAPFWADINIRISGFIAYATFTSGSPEVNQLSSFIQNREDPSFSGTWMILAEWNKVPEFGGSSSNTNTFQAAVITDGSTSYAVFIYRCGYLEWSRSTAIGYRADGSFYRNHPLSTSANVNSIACVQSPTSEWNNVVYKLTSIDSCTSTQFGCNNGQCISSSSRCSAYNDCGDGSDEEFCSSCSGGFLCNNGRCIASSAVWNGVNDCLDNSDESILCTHGDVRLAGGLIPTEGRVELCNSGKWTGVCHSNRYQYAFVVCRQLGYPATEALSFPTDYSTYGVGVIIGLTFLCYGNESQLLDCAHSTGSCSRHYVYGVRCLGETVSARQCFDGNIPHVDGAMRLVGGEDANEGRVEICSNGLWGSVCSRSWDSRDATVVCKQLGFQNPVAYPYLNAHFGAGTGPILLSGANCAGTEGRLQDCQSRSSPQTCSHSQDIGVRCAHSEYSGCVHGEIRLVGGQSEYEGRVEICINGVWGSVCWNNWRNRLDWDDRDARVVCRQIGLPFQLATAVRLTSLYGESVGPFHLTSVGCGGDEENLLDCSNSSVNTCYPGQEAGVKCGELADCLYGDARLVGGETLYEGRVEVCIDSYWVSACSRYYRNWENEGKVICRQITGDHNPRTSVITQAERLFGQPPSQLQLYFSNVHCTGSEERLVECSHSSSSCSGYNVGVICYVSSNCSDGTVRLVDGETETQGRVEICQNGTLWAVSDFQWDLNDAIVICKHLGYPFTWALPLSSSFFGRGNSTVLIQDLGCLGNESVVDDCSATVYSIRSQYNYNEQDIPTRISGVAGVICAGSETSQPECGEGELRLVGGQTRNEGRVEVCDDGFWATICDEDWGQREAMVVCRQAGLPTTGALPVRNASYGDSIGPVITAGVSCTGREVTLLECTWEAKMNCNPVGRSAGVICQDAYTVTVTSDPPVGEGPFLLGSTVTLHCSVDPAPPQTVTYTWRDSVSNAEAVSVDSTSPNATLTIPIGHPHEAKYFCWTQSSDGSFFGVGAINIRVKGFLDPIGDTALQFTPPQLLSMQINITSLQFAGNYFRSFSWHHNGIEISPASDHRVTVSSDNTTLTIENSTEADAGVYEAKFTGLLVQPYSEICEKEILALVRHYPLASPAVFYTSTQGGRYGQQHSPGFAISIEGSEYQHPLTVNDTISLTASSSIHSTLLRNFVSISWYHNGHSLPSGAVTGDLNKVYYDYISQLLTVENITTVNSGITEALLQLQSVQSYLQQFSCPNDYTYFITHGSRSGIGVLVLEQTFVHFKYYEPPTVSIHPSSASLKPGEHASFVCRAEGGYPHSHKISWIKHGEVIANGTAFNVTTTFTRFPFGQYTCVVNNSVITRQRTLLIKEEGTMEIQLDLHSYDKCTRWNEATLQENINELIESMTEIIQRHCMCTFSTSDLQETNATCFNAGSNLSIQILLAYSSASGFTTASDVIEILQNWMQDAPSAIFVLGGTNVSVTQVCTPMCTTDQPQQEQLQQDIDASAIVGALFGGLFAGMALISVPAIIIFLVWKKKHTSKAHDIPPSLGSDGAQTVRYASAKPESVQMAMKLNESYETVGYPEEGIYEVPT